MKAFARYCLSWQCRSPGCFVITRHLRGPRVALPKTNQNIRPLFKLYKHEKFNLHNSGDTGNQLAARRLCLPHRRRCHTYYHCNSCYPATIQSIWQWRRVPARLVAGYSALFQRYLLFPKEKYRETIWCKLRFFNYENFNLCGGSSAYNCLAAGMVQLSHQQGCNARHHHNSGYLAGL